MKKSPLVLLAPLALAFSAPWASGVPVISEFLADNDLGLRDEDGDDEDWIEIHNPDTSAIDLAGWRITDDSLDLTKWVFPSRLLGPDQRLIVFASNKDRKPASGNLHTNFRLDQDGDYLSLISPSGTPSTTFSPLFHFQTKNTSFGTGFAGGVTTTDATPTTLVAGTSYNRVKLTGVGSAQFDGSLNSFDDSTSPPEHQQFLWYDYSSRLGTIPAGQTIVEATLEWSGTARIFAGVSGLSTVVGSIGVFPAPDAAKGVTTIATGADGRDLIDFYASRAPESTVGHEPGVARTFLWNVTNLVRQWMANPGDPLRGKFILVNSAQPAWIAWDQNRLGPKLLVRTVNNPAPVTAVGFMTTPTPGAANTGVTPAGPLVREVTANVAAPPAGGPVVVSARVTPSLGGAVNTVTLGFRKSYEAEQSLAMADDGQNGDETAGDGIFSGAITGAVVEAGRMLRWKVTATDASGFQTKIPPFRDNLDSPEYFGTVPVDPAVTTNLPLFHWFIQNPAAANTALGTRSSIAFKDEFYDNVGINIHGQSTQAGTFPKKSYDIDGNRGYRFKWSDDPAALRAKDINLLTNFGDKTKSRHCLAYEMNQLAGVAAHYCFPVRVQQNSAFFGVLDFVEDADDVYLERTGLNPDGALYKMYNNMGAPATDAVTGAEKKNRKTENNADLQEFLNGMNLADPTARRNFLYDHVDIPKMINFMAANTVTANIDLHAKNYYIYRDTGETGLWTLLPWDLDLSLGRLWTPTNNYFDDGMYINSGGFRSGTGQALVARLYGITEFDVMVRRRIRSLHEQFWKQSATSPDPTRWVDLRFQEMLASIGNDAALDHAKYPPGPWHNAGVTTDSPFKNNTMSQEIDRVFSSFIVQRINTMYGDALMPPTQNLNALQPLTISQVDVSPASGNQDEEFIRIQNPNAVAVDIAGWKLTEAIAFTFEPGSVLPANGSVYVSPDVVAFKARTTAPRGGQGLIVLGEYSGRLSNLGETIHLLDANGTERATHTYPGAPSVWQESLVITEIMYNPGGDGLAEFVELMNIGTAALALAEVRFTAGIEFDFTASAVTSLAPGARVLLVRNVAAFQAMHGAGHPIAGEFADGSALDNGGEAIKLEDPDNNTIKEFNYDDVPPWPMLPDGGGFSLVLIHPASNPDPGNPLNWRASAAVSGSPAAGESTTFTGDPLADGDGDGLSAILEYALGSNAAIATVFNHLGMGPGAGTQLEVEITHALAADDVDLRLEWSPTLGSWTEPPADLIAETRLPNGQTRQTWRLVLPEPIGPRHFLRLRAVMR